jgi:Domain of unknown function (DUF4174)
MPFRKTKFYFLIALTMTMTSFQTSNPRRLLLFARDGASFQLQLQLLAKDSIGLSERDVKIEIFSFQNTLARKYSVDKSQLTVILIGRDGGEKYRTHVPVSTQTLFDIIDSMPMRQSEMRTKSN